MSNKKRPFRVFIPQVKYCSTLLQTGKLFEGEEVGSRTKSKASVREGQHSLCQGPALVILCIFLHPSIVQLGYVV